MILQSFEASCAGFVNSLPWFEVTRMLRHSPKKWVLLNRPDLPVLVDVQSNSVRYVSVCQ
jgi:hypothetical protein